MAQMTEAEARHTTKLLQAKTQQLAKLIKEAHDGKVWEALGYKSFSEWANKELPFTHGRAFQLLNIGVLTEELVENISLNNDFILTDKQARGISWYGREQFMKDFSAAAGEDKSANEMMISKLISAKVSAMKENDDADEEDVKAVKVRAKLERVNDSIISKNEKNSRTLMSLSRTLRAQTSEFPRPEKLSPELRERGTSLLLEAKSSLEKTHDEIIDLMKKRSEGQLDFNNLDEKVENND